MTPKLSIIIPCYNSEKTIEGTLLSVLEQDFHNWEAIIINDGSIDSTEQISVKFVERDNRFKYFSKPNEGLGKTRNYGIAKAIGEYILPLDSDNLVEKDFAQKAIEILSSNTEVGVVHGHAEYFGERNGVWNIDKFDLEKILAANYIDACAIYRKELWSKVGGYEEKMPYQGHEDWEFWIALGKLQTKFHHLEQISFQYYISKDSMIHSFSAEMVIANQDYIVKKHSLLYHEIFSKNYNKLKEVQKQNKVNLQSEKFIINLVVQKILGFKIFNLKNDI